MKDFEEYIIQKSTELHVKINYGTSYKSNSEGAYEKLKDVIEFDQLKEIVNDCDEFDHIKMAQEVSKRVRKRIGIN